jgi:hypothetical protein
MKRIAIAVATIALAVTPAAASAVTVLPGANDRPGNSDCNRQANQPQGVNGLCR